MAGASELERDEMPMARELRVGTDLCRAADIQDSIDQFGDRFLTRVFTPDELKYAGESTVLCADRLAARFAAKEATIKVLRPIEARPNWRSIQVRRDHSGWCDVVLDGFAATLAQELGICSLALSMSHDGGQASAVVIAEIDHNRKLQSARHL